MTMQQLARIVTLKGKKESISIGQVSEVLKIVSQMIIEDPEKLVVMLQNGIKSKKKKK